MSRTYVNDGGTTRDVRQMWVNDGGTIRRVRRAYTIDTDSEINKVFHEGDRYTMSGSSATYVAPVNEVLSLDLRDDFTGARAAGIYDSEFSNSGHFSGVPSDPTFGPSSSVLRTRAIVPSEVYDSDNEWTIVAPSSFPTELIYMKWNGPSADSDTTLTIGYELVMSQVFGSSSAFGIQITARSSESSSSALWNQSFTVGTITQDSEVFRGNVVVNNTNAFRPGQVYEFRLRASQGQHFVVNSANVVFAPGNHTVASIGPASYTYTIHDNQDSDIATGTYNAPADQSDENVVISGLRDAIVATANADTDSEFDTNWTNGNQRTTPIPGLALSNCARLTNLSYGTGTNGFVAERGQSSNNTYTNQSDVPGWNWTTGTGFIMGIRSLDTEHDTLRLQLEAWANRTPASLRPIIVTPAGDTSQYGIYDVNAQAFRFNTGNIAFRAGSNDPGGPSGNDEGFIDSEGSFPSTGNFDVYFGMDTDGNDFPIVLQGNPDEDIAAATPDFNVTFSGSVNFITGTTLAINGFTRTVTSSTVTTIEGFVDALVGTYTSTNNGTIIVSKVNASTIRVLYSVAQVTTTLDILNQTFTSNANGVQPTATIGSTTLTNSGVPTISYLSWGGFTSGNLARRRAFIHTNTDYDFGLTVSTTSNSSTNAVPILNADPDVVDGVTEVMRTTLSFSEPSVALTLQDGRTVDQIGERLVSVNTDFDYDSDADQLVAPIGSTITIMHNNESDPLTFTEVDPLTPVDSGG